MYVQMFEKSGPELFVLDTDGVILDGKKDTAKEYFRKRHQTSVWPWVKYII